MGDGVAATGIADGLDTGDNIAHLTGGKCLHGDPFQLKNTDLFDTIGSLVGFKNDIVAWLYLTLNDAQMNRFVDMIVGLEKTENIRELTAALSSR